MKNIFIPWLSAMSLASVPTNAQSTKAHYLYADLSEATATVLTSTSADVESAYPYPLSPEGFSLGDETIHIINTIYPQKSSTFVYQDEHNIHGGKDPASGMFVNYTNFGKIKYYFVNVLSQNKDINTTVGRAFTNKMNGDFVVINLYNIIHVFEPLNTQLGLGLSRDELVQGVFLEETNHLLHRELDERQNDLLLAKNSPRNYMMLKIYAMCQQLGLPNSNREIQAKYEKQSDQHYRNLMEKVGVCSFGELTTEKLATMVGIMVAEKI